MTDGNARRIGQYASGSCEMERFELSSSGAVGDMK